MARQIFVNLPVKDLDRSVEFFTNLGFTFDKQFTNADATCMIVGENIFVMLLVEKFFRTFTKKDIADSSKVTEALICISAESREEVDSLIAKAREAGGTIPRDIQDYGWMYSHAFEDIDGHIWELAYMDMSAVPDMTESA